MPVDTSPCIETKKQLTLLQGVAYGLPLLPLYFMFGPIAILQGIYAKYFGLALTTIASVLFIARLFDAISDPLIGFFADRYYARYGSRKIFIAVGGILFIVASWFLYVPPANVSEGYFLFWFLAFYLAFTLFEIPHLAWGSALAENSQEKNRVYGLRSFFIFLGALLFFGMPLLPWFETNEFTPQTLKWSALVAGVLMLPTLFICIRSVPRVLVRSEGSHSNAKFKKDDVLFSLKRIFYNKPLRVLTVAHIFTGFGSGMWLTLLFIFVDAYLNLGEQFALAYVVSFSISILTLRLWFLLARSYGKQVTWMSGMVLVVLGLVGTGLLSPNDTGWLELLLCMIFISSGFACFHIMVPSLLSDIIDYGTLKFGTDQTATYFSLYTFINKTVAALGGALGLAIAGWVGFDPSAISHSEKTIQGLIFGIAWVPAAAIFLSIIFISRIPITANQHAIIRRRLDIRNVRMMKTSI